MPKEKKVPRSKEMVLLAYFMEKYGDRTASSPTAPSELNGMNLRRQLLISQGFF